jgi:hypothetical protein
MAGRGQRCLLAPILPAVHRLVSFVPLPRTKHGCLFGSILGSSDACDGACIRCSGFDNYDGTNFITLTANISVDMRNHTNVTVASL